MLMTSRASVADVAAVVERLDARSPVRAALLETLQRYKEEQDEAAARPRGVAGGLHDATIPYEIDTATGLAVGARVPEAQINVAAKRPDKTTILEGRYCRLEPLDATKHSRDLFFASTAAPDAERRFRYLFDEVPGSVEDMVTWIEAQTKRDDVVYFAVVDITTGRAEGRQSFLRIEPEVRSIELGNVLYGPAIAGSRVATEANYLVMRHAFEELGYRRFEWKCDALNAKSRAAARRLGLTYEGHFRRALVVKGRTRDTAWFAALDDEWRGGLKQAFETWLDPDNFVELVVSPAGNDETAETSPSPPQQLQQRQKTRLSDLTKAALHTMYSAD